MKRLEQISLAPLLALLLVSYPAGAQDTMELAKKEGKVVWYSSASLSLSQKLCNMFNAKKLGFECVLHRDGSGNLYTRLQQEAKAGIHNADVFHTSSIGHFDRAGSDVHISPYKPTPPPTAAGPAPWRGGACRRSSARRSARPRSACGGWTG